MMKWWISQYKSGRLVLHGYRHILIQGMKNEPLCGTYVYIFRSKTGRSFVATRYNSCFLFVPCRIVCSQNRWRIRWVTSHSWQMSKVAIEMLGYYAECTFCWIHFFSSSLPVNNKIQQLKMQVCSLFLVSCKTLFDYTSSFDFFIIW
jgi:hypothetical protein